MTKLYKKIAALIASGAMLFNMAAPVLATTTLELSGNGADSNSTIELNRTQTTNVVQSNEAEINNDVQVKADTGSNEANKNTNGEISIDTGDAKVGVSVANSVNTNVAELDNCGDCGGDTSVLINGNGADTENKVDLNQHNNTLVVQTNNADIENKVDADAKTGDNEANKNTGGNVEIETGDAKVLVGVSTQANANAARIGGDGTGSMLSARILGNGADSENTIELGLGHILDVVQSNEADIENRVYADAKTGDNEAEENTGGEVSIDTGDAKALVGIDNMTNFNAIDLGCDCFIEDIMAKIADNGADSDNYLVADLVDSMGVFQANCAPLSVGSVDSFTGNHRDDCELENKVDAEAITGDNEVEENTAESEFGGDPSVETGDAKVEAYLENKGNVNSVGSGASDVIDEDDEEESGIDWGSTGIEFDFHLNLSGILSMLGL